MKKLDYVDALRGLAILGVLMVHCNQFGASGMPHFMDIITEQGLRGVQLFFLASAFTLFLSFKSRLTKEHFPVRNFIFRRFFRIAPMYYIGICYFLYQDGFGPRFWLGNKTHISTANVLSNFAFLHGFNPYWINSVVPGGWSIGVETTFYLLLPFLFSKIKNVQQAFILFAGSAMLKLVLDIVFIKFLLVGADRLWYDYLYLYFPTQLPIFALGIVAFFIINEGQKINFRNIALLSSITVAVFIAAQLITGMEWIFLRHLAFGIGFLLLIVWLSRYRWKLVVNPAIKFIGKISFSMYFVHFAVLHWLAAGNAINYFSNGIANYLTRYSIVLVISAALSALFYRLVEVPFQDLGKNIITRLEKPAPIAG